jgi:4-amino-4-deoxy-L-arabinose transferase-like glycosyltransferase
MEAVSRPAATPDGTTINAELAEHAEKSGSAGAAVSAFDVVRVRVALALVVALAAALRFYGLAWGAPYFHFHIDEHFVFVGAERLRVSMQAAATSGKFFMYGPLPMHLLNGVVWLYEAIKAPLALTVFQDQVTYMVMGRAISAAMGTATVLVVYFVGKRVSNAVGGVLASALLATTVVHIAESHSFRVDLAMIFFAAVAWLFALRIAESGRLRDYLLAGAFAGAAIGSKYSAAFIVGVIGVAHLVAPGRPRAWRDRRGWLAWGARGVSPLVVCAVTFAAINPMAFLYYNRFRQDILEQIVNPLTGGTKPLWVAQFTDVQPQLYWFTTNFWWGFGPAMELWGLAGLAWLIWRRTPAAIVAAAFPLIYFLTAGGTTAPMARYALPLAPAFAVAAGGLSAYLLERPRWRRAATAITAVVVAGTTFYALAYMNIYRSRDARLAASDFLLANVPEGSRVLVEPSHGIPPLGSYLRNPDFSGDHVMWGAMTHRDDYYSFYTLDPYVYLYGRRPTAEEKQRYIQSRLDLVDFIVMDDFYLQLYRHLPADAHGVVKQYYDDLFNGRLGFDLIKTFKVYPSIFGVTINDDRAELSSRMNDHPRVYIFMRRKPH